MNQLDNTLIENALAITGKKMEDMNIPKYLGDSVVNGMAFPEFGDEFSIEKFAYYILSPEFIAIYSEEVERGYNTNDADYELIKEFSLAIYEYQSGNEKPLLELISKIIR